MALDKTVLAAQLLNVFNDALVQAQDGDNDGLTIRTQICNGIADAIDQYVKTIVITAGTGAISVTGSSGVSTNPAPIVISNTPPNSIS